MRGIPWWVLWCVVLVLHNSHIEAQPSRLWLRDGQPSNASIVGYSSASHYLYTRWNSTLFVWDTDADTVAWRTDISGLPEHPRVVGTSYVNDSLVVVNHDGMFFWTRIKDGSIAKRTSCYCLSWVSPSYNVGVSKTTYNDLDSIRLIDIRSDSTLWFTAWERGPYNFLDYDTTRKRLYFALRNVLAYVDSTGTRHIIDTLSKLNDAPVHVAHMNDGSLLVTVVQERDSVRAVMYSYRGPDLRRSDSLQLFASGSWTNSPFVPIGEDAGKIIFDAFRNSVVVVQTSPLRIEHVTKVDDHDAVASFVGPDSLAYVDRGGATIIHDLYSEGKRTLLPKRATIRNATRGPRSELLVEQGRDIPLLLNPRTGNDDRGLWTSIPQYMNAANEALHVGGRSGCPIVAIGTRNRTYLMPFGDTVAHCEIIGDRENFGLGATDESDPYVCWTDSLGIEADIVFKHSYWLQGYSEDGVGIYRTTSPCRDTTYRNVSMFTTINGVRYAGDAMPLPTASEDGSAIFVPLYDIGDRPDSNERPSLLLVTGVQNRFPFSTGNRSFRDSYRGVFLESGPFAAIDTDSGYTIISSADITYADPHDYGSRYLPLASMHTSAHVIMYSGSTLRCMDPFTGAVTWQIPIPEEPTLVLIEPHDKWMFVIYAFGRVEMYMIDPSMSVPLPSAQHHTVHLQPHPVQDVVTVTASELIQEYEVRDLVGRQVDGEALPAPSSHFTFNSSGLVPGTYILVLRIEGSYITHTFVKR